MRFRPLPVEGAFLVEPEPARDDRGFFARTWDRAEFAARGLDPRLEQCSISFNETKGTLRGLHHQVSPHEEAKLVRCTMGAVWDVVLDLRPDSPSYLKWHAEELTPRNRAMMYVPPGCAHGFQTLEDASEVLYLISTPHVPAAARGVRWDDPSFGIGWPMAPTRMSERDRTYEDHRP